MGLACFMASILWAIAFETFRLRGLWGPTIDSVLGLAASLGALGWITIGCWLILR